MGDEPTVLLVVPIDPAASGNGLAMRAGMLLDSLAAVAAVHVLIVPVSGRSDDHAFTARRARRLTIIQPVAPEAAHDHTTRQLADPGLRQRLAQTAPLPRRAALAPPTLTTEIMRSLPHDVDGIDAVLAMRLYLAPLGIHLGRSLAATRVVVDADDDDGALLRTLGEADEADAYDRLAKCWLPDADAVLAASRESAASIADRNGVASIDVVPNTMVVPARVTEPPGADRLLLLGNLTYEPNRVAARLLATEILPLVRAQRPDATLALVGEHGGQLDDLGRLDGVHVTGRVPDVAPHYASADVVVVPLEHGSGTRIKVIEAFAHRRPVVGTRLALAGLGVTDGHDAVLAESPAELAHSITALLADPARARALADRAAELVRRFAPEVVAPLVRAAVLGSDAG